MINAAVFPMGSRIETRRLGSGLLVISVLLLCPVPLVKAGDLVPGEPTLVAQASNGAAEVPAEVMAWRQQVETLYKQGKFQEAISLQEQELAWTERNYGPDHPDTATSLNDLAVLYLSQGAYAKAEPFFLRALTIWEKALGPDHPDTAQSLKNLAEL